MSNSIRTDFESEESPVCEQQVPAGMIEDAGEDLREPRSARYGRYLLQAAEDRFVAAQRTNHTNHTAACSQVREAISLAASATYWLEGTSYLTNSHYRMDKMGKFAREECGEGCALRWDGNRYANACPIAIAHKRFGFSPNMIIRRMRCSLCGDDISECPHLRNHRYRVRGGAVHSPWGHCPICIQQECHHDPNSTYLVVPTAVIDKIERATEVSIVARPRQPDARLSEIPIGSDELRKVLGTAFTPGMTLYCNRCLSPCTGFEHLSNPPDRASDSPNATKA